MKFGNDLNVWLIPGSYSIRLIIFSSSTFHNLQCVFELGVINQAYVLLCVSWSFLLNLVVEMHPELRCEMQKKLLASRTRNSSRNFFFLYIHFFRRLGSREGWGKRKQGGRGEEESPDVLAQTPDAHNGLHEKMAELKTPPKTSGWTARSAATWGSTCCDTDLFSCLQKLTEMAAPLRLPCKS